VATIAPDVSPAQQVPYGPDNPHPLSHTRTELVWEGKYDEYGNRREVDIAGCWMPLQKIETIDEPRSRAEAERDEGSLFELQKQSEKLGDFRNLLIWGDNKLVMASLHEFKGKIDLLYIDPPFDVGVDFTMEVPIGDDEEYVRKDQSALEMVAYKDMWGRGTDSYLHTMYERLTMMRELLSERGSIYVHCDWHVGHYIKLLLDHIFGKGLFLNEIIWHYRRWPAQSSTYQRSHDVLLWYSKSDQHVWNQTYQELSAATLKRFGGKQVRGETTKVVLAEESKGAPARDVWDIPHVLGANPERLDFPTQKPEALLEQVITASSREGDLVADFFCGSGTTRAVAERLGRRWIMCDFGRFAIHSCRKRLLDLQRKLHEDGRPYRAFDVYNLGRYERQWWQKERLKGADEEHRKVVLGFYKAEILDSSPSPLLHGRKGPAFVHVAAIDTIFTRQELASVSEAAKQAGAKRANCLAWEFEMDLRLEAHKLEAELGVEIRLLRIPREIMEKNRTKVTFFEIATLEAQPVYKKANGRQATDVKLVNFLPSLAEVPENELQALQERAIKHGFDFIDFWAVDFDYKDGQPFKHHWQAYRTRKNRTLPTVSDQGYIYEKAATYQACVKVVDTFGCDTSITVPIEVG
jgi:adenine-specific DNA-methyltransferase